MKKEDYSGFFNSQDGKLNIMLLFSIVLIFVLSIIFVNALTITQQAPGTLTINGSRTINFTFTVLWQDPNQNAAGNCSIWTNITGTWAEAVRNGTNNTGGVIYNSSTTISTLNVTLDRDGNFSWAVGCQNSSTAVGELNFSLNRTLTVDTFAPALTLNTPNGGVLADASEYNITSFETATFYVNVSDNTTHTVSMILNSVAFVTSLLAPTGVNDSNRTMTAGTVISPGTRQYYFNLSGIINFNSTFTSPGPHSVVFCANDSLGRTTCSNRSDFIIMGMNITQMENMFSGMQQCGQVGQSACGAGAVSFGGLNITLGNGTEIPDSTFMNPVVGVTVGGLTHKNFTFIINFSANAIVHIVGGRIDESQFANASNTRVNNTPTTEVRQQVGRYTTNMAWADIASFIPSEVSYEYGIIQLGGTHGRTMYCNGSTMSAPNCHTISQCNSTVFGILNHTVVIPPNDACWLTAGTINTVDLTSGFTYIFVDHFSGGVGADDTGPPNVTFVAPSATAANHRLNRSTAVTQLINFTVDDTDSTGLNLTLNNSINVTITLGGSTVAFFNFTNDTSTKISCDSVTDRISLQNTTKIQCNATYGFNSNGTYTINITGRDTSNNSNAMNTTSNYVYFTVDQIPPVFIYYNFTNASSFNTSDGGASVIELGTSSGSSRAQGDANTGRIFAVANWTDNLTQLRHGQLQFYNGTSQAWQTLNTTAVNGTDGAFVNGGWTNFSFPIPKGHNNFEGTNVSFRIIVNDSVGNVNSSAIVKNFTIQINDTTVPTTIINGTIAVNNSNITATSISVVGWAVDDNRALTEINISVDGAVNNNDGCDKFRRFTTAAGPNNVESNRNKSFSTSTDPACTLANGSHYIEVKAVDSWSNLEVIFHNFTVQASSTPVITIQNVSSSLFGGVNTTNVTSSTNIFFTATVGATGQLKNMSFTSSCNSTGGTFANNSAIRPFQGSTCEGASANRTITVTASDFSGNTGTTTFQFLVDDVGPSLAVWSPTQGGSFANNVSLNWSAKDGSLYISFTGYYLDDKPVAQLNFTAGAVAQGAAAANVTDSRSINFTPGTHTIKFTANDTLGNAVNSSVITFTATGPIRPAEINASMSIYLATVSGYPANATISKQGAGGEYQPIGSANETDVSNTFEILLYLNQTSTSNQVNVTITEINGSGANWDKINFSVLINDTEFEADVENNYTASMFNFVVFNASFEEFLPNANHYFGVILLPYNISGERALAQQIWFFPNASKVSRSSDRTNVSKCISAFTRTTTTPCWNYTSGGKTLLFVPHFSGGGGGNDTTAPTVNVTTPTQNASGISMFEPNITVSADAITCLSSVNGTVANVTMTKSENICKGQTERFKNLNVAEGGYTFTFTVTDSSGNINRYVWRFNVSDNTAPNTPNSSRVTSVDVTSSGATVNLGGFNESVNATVQAAPNVTGTFTVTQQTDFNTTQAVSITGLSANTKYHFNVTVCDFNGNCARNGTDLSFTTSAAAAAAAAEAAAAAGAAGGGAAAPSAVEASAGRQWDSLAAGSSGVLTINNEKIAVTGVIVDVKNAVTNPSITVESLSSNPLSTSAAAKVYQYLQLRKSNIADLDASKITINFRVPKSWLTSNSVAESDIVLWRYSGGSWNRLDTKLVSSDGSYARYEAITPGFSTFAIGNKEGGISAFAIIDIIRDFYAGTSKLTAFDIIDQIRAFYGG